MLRYVFLLFLLIFSLSSFAQQYDRALGARIGLSQGITYKHFVNRDFAMEGMALVKEHGYNLTLLVEKQDDFLDTRGLQWFYGIGGHTDILLPVNAEETSKSMALFFGLDAIFGFEYKLRRKPFAISVDWKPTMIVQQGSGNLRNEGALSVRYTW